MPIRFLCPHCQAKLTVSRRYGGRRGRCPSCSAKVQVPEINIEDADLSADDPGSQSDSDRTPIRNVSSQSEESSTNAGRRFVESSQNPASEISRSKSAARRARELRERVGVARWVIYLQGALLGIVATSFFVFGMAVGSHTQVSKSVNARPGKCTVTGTVYFDDGNYRQSDLGAVVILLPVNHKPQQRPSTEPLRPDSFVPLDNSSIEEIRQFGGEVVRVNVDGSFQTVLDGLQSYWVLTISKNKRADSSEIKKQTRAEIGAYFFPIEDLLGDRAFHWSKIKLTSSSERLEPVVF